MNDYYIERAENNRYARVTAYQRRSTAKRSFLMCLIFIVITICTIFFVKSHIYASNNDNNMKKQYKSITIYCGESVESIVSDYSEYGYSSDAKFMKELCSINSISADTVLIAGNHLIIPYYEGQF